MNKLLPKDLVEQKVLDKINYQKAAINDIERELNTRRSSKGSRGSNDSSSSSSSRYFDAKKSLEEEKKPKPKLKRVDEEDEDQRDEEGL